MHGLPDHTRRVAERLLGAYCQRLCPPEFDSQVVLGYRDGARAGNGTVAPGFTLHEVRRICGVPGTARLEDVAQLRYEPRAGAWRLLCRAGGSEDEPRWRRYPGVSAQRNPAAVMRVLDADPLGLLWPRINGASLRWCSSRGRCLGCTQRYAAVLGGAEAAADADAARGSERPISRA